MRIYDIYTSIAAFESALCVCAEDKQRALKLMCMRECVHTHTELGKTSVGEAHSFLCSQLHPLRIGFQ